MICTLKKISTVQSLHRAAALGDGRNWLEVRDSWIVEGDLLLLLWGCGYLVSFVQKCPILNTKSCPFFAPC